MNRVSRFVLGDDDVAVPAQRARADRQHPEPTRHSQRRRPAASARTAISTSAPATAAATCAATAAASSRTTPPAISAACRERSCASPVTARSLPGNPYTGGNSDRCNVTGSTSVNRKCQEIYAWGLRNPFRTAFDVNSPTTRFYINDVGEAQVGGDRRRRGRRRLRLERARGPLRARLVHRLRPAADRHDQPDLRLRPHGRLHLHHGSATSCRLGSGRSNTTARICMATSSAARSSGSCPPPAAASRRPSSPAASPT